MTKQESAKKLIDTIIDYQESEEGRSTISVDIIVRWADQFEEDGEFVLSELAHLMPQCYVNKEMAVNFFLGVIMDVSRRLNLKTINDLIPFCSFLNLQERSKSQSDINHLIGKRLNGQSVDFSSAINAHNKTYYFYFDDILATGGTIRRDMSTWLTTIEKGRNLSNLELLLSKKIFLFISVLALQSWGKANTEWYLMQTHSRNLDKYINWRCFYSIENHPKFLNQKFNICYPINNSNRKINTYFANLEQTQYEQTAFRDPKKPLKETFFSNKENRNKFEQIMLLKGIDILSNLEKPKSNQRPLGFCHPQHKILGSGTMFFTWRNIPNNAPLAFWWDVSSHNWHPLFNVNNRGGNNEII